MCSKIPAMPVKCRLSGNLTYWAWHQRFLVNCDWMPVSYTNRQPSCPCGHPTWWTLSQRSHTVSTTACHGAWRSADQRSLVHRVGMHGISASHPFVLAAQQHMSSSEDNNRSAALWAFHQWSMQRLENTARLHTLIPDIGTHPRVMTLLRLVTRGGRSPPCKNFCPSRKMCWT